VLPETSTSEVVWSLGGGGPSIYEPMPAYQSRFLTATSDPVLKLNNGKRGIPDVAYNADPSGSPIAVCVKGAWYAIGGTSEGAPQWSAIVARLGQYVKAQGSSVSSLLMTNGVFLSLRRVMPHGWRPCTFDVSATIAAIVARGKALSQRACRHAGN